MQAGNAYTLEKTHHQATKLHTVRLAGQEKRWVNLSQLPPRRERQGQMARNGWKALEQHHGAVHHLVFAHGVKEVASGPVHIVPCQAVHTSATRRLQVRFVELMNKQGR